MPIAAWFADKPLAMAGYILRTMNLLSSIRSIPNVHWPGICRLRDHKRSEPSQSCVVAHWLSLTIARCWCSTQTRHVNSNLYGERWVSVVQWDADWGGQSDIFDAQTAQRFTERTMQCSISILTLTQQSNGKQRRGSSDVRRSIERVSIVCAMRCEWNCDIHLFYFHYEYRFRLEHRGVVAPVPRW